MSGADHVYLEDVGLDGVAALLLELATQLHVERQRRMALEEIMTRRGLLAREDVEALAKDPDFLARSQDALNEALRRLVRIMAEAGDPRGPLRAEALP